jgi:8-oxo-dGTP pyrophosphatase MutT (NUDIX family)
MPSIIGAVPTTPDRLRELLLTPEEAAEMDAMGGHHAAAVLVPLYVHGGDLHAVFTKRRDDLRRHAGEISFPGGRPDFEEEDLRTTALREAEEEIGLPREDVEIVGALPTTGTFVTNYRIHPYVGVIEPGKEWELQPREVEVVLELSLPDLIRGFEMQRLIKRGVPFKTPTYTVDGNFVWGATARILHDLLERLEPIL